MTTEPIIIGGARNAEPPADQETILFNRPPRVLRVPPTEEVEIPGPPPQPSTRAMPPILTIVIPLVSALIYGIFSVLRAGPSGSPWLSAPILVIALISAGAAFYNYRRMKAAQEEAQQAYEESRRQALERARQRLQRLDAEQRACYEANDPALPVLLKIVEGQGERDGTGRPEERLWERRPADPDFLHLRLGLGDRPTSLVIKPPSVNAYSRDVEQPQALAAEFSRVRNVPVAVDLPATNSLGIAGPNGRAIELLFALVWQIVSHHAPNEVRIAAFWDSIYDTSWDWLRLLPHTRSLDGDPSYRLLARYDRSPDDLRQVLASLAKEVKRRAAGDQSSERQPHLVVILSDHHRYGAIDPLFAQLIGSAALDVSVICLVPIVSDVPSECGGYIDATGRTGTSVRLALAGPGGGQQLYQPDAVDDAQSRALARALARVELADADGRRELPRNVPLLRLLDISDARLYDPGVCWKETPKNSWHPVPVGLYAADRTIEIDLNEGVHGVHGMIAGATGAGKSELLLSFLMALAIRHSPDRLNFMLIDFKGGATFRDLASLPHTAGFVTDLSGFLAERALIAMNSELDRRKRLLNSKGVPNIRSYRKAGHDVPGQHLPNLLIAIDEFDEMIRDYPEFQLELVRVAKQGRSLGVHLLFATQQPSLIKEGLLNNLSYWMSLRVNSKEDSKAMVGLPDAALLGTDTPGRGYFRDKNSGVRMFQSALITAAYKPSEGRTSRQTGPDGRTREVTDEGRALRALLAVLSQLVEQVAGAVTSLRRRELVDHAIQELCAQFNRELDRKPLPTEEGQQRQLAADFVHQLLTSLEGLTFDAAKTSEADAVKAYLAEAASSLLTALRGEREQVSELQLVVRRMVEDRGPCYAAGTYPIWAAPLPPLLPLVDLMGGHEAAWLSIPVGLRDLPEDARNDALRCDLAGVSGNVLAIGAAGSGKTAFLRTVLVTLAATHAPTDLWVYSIDASGAGLGLRGRLSHLADALSPRQHVQVERLAAELQDQIERRRALFQQHGVSNLAQYRERAGQGDGLPPPPPAVVITIDNIAELISQNENIVETLKALMREGRAYGIFFVITAYTVRDVSSLLAAFETRLALRLNSDDDSAQLIGKDYASRLIRPDMPGRGFMRGSPRPVEFQIALPTLRRHSLSLTAQDAIAVAYSDPDRELDAAAAVIQERWRELCAEQPARLPRPLRLLPTAVELRELGTMAEARALWTVPLGIEGSTLRPLFWSLESTAHLLVMGALRSGKGTLIRTLLAGLAARHTPDQIEFILVDYGLRTLRPFERAAHTRAFAGLTIAKEQRDVRIAADKEELTAVLQTLNADLSERNRLMRQGLPLPKCTVLVIHNWDLLGQPDAPLTAALTALELYARRGGDLGLHCIVSNLDFGSSAMGLIRSLRTSCAEVVMGRPLENAATATVLNRRFRAVLGGEMPPGRGFVIENGEAPRVVQFVYADESVIAQAAATTTADDIFQAAAATSTTPDNYREGEGCFADDVRGSADQGADCPGSSSEEAPR